MEAGKTENLTIETMNTRSSQNTIVSEHDSRDATGSADKSKGASKAKGWGKDDTRLEKDYRDKSNTYTFEDTTDTEGIDIDHFLGILAAAELVRLMKPPEWQAQQGQYRGWRHIHRMQPCSLCSQPLFTKAPGHLSGDSASSHLPSEVIHQLANLLRTLNMKHGSEVRPTRAALVCKHWADVCLQPHPKWEDALHGREDVMTLRELVASPGSYLKYSVRRFSLMSYYLGPNALQDSGVSSGTGEPWLHLALDVRRLLPNYNDKYDWAEVVGPLCHGLKTMRSIHTYLPRSMPPSFSSGVRELQLSHIRFQQASDLYRLVGELRSLERFKGFELSWAASPSVLPGYLRRQLGVRKAKKCSNWMHAVTLQGCTSGLEAVALCALSHLEHWDILYAMDQLFVLQSTSEGTFETAWRSKETSGRQLEDYHVAVMYKISWTWSNHCNIQLRALLSPTVAHGPQRYKVTLLLWSQSFADLASHIDLKIFERNVMAHLQPEIVSVGRTKSTVPFSEEDWLMLDDRDKQVIIGSLPSLATAGKLSFSTPAPAMAWDESSSWREELDDADGTL